MLHSVGAQLVPSGENPVNRKTDRVAKFTAQWVESVKADGQDRVDWYDDACPELTLRVSPTGSKVFYWVGRVGRHRTRMKIGDAAKISIAAARLECKRISGEAASGGAPKPKARTMREDLTLGELHRWYIETHGKPHKRSWRQNQRTYELHLSHWENRNISTITREMVNRLHGEIAETHGPFAANSAINLLRYEFRRAAAIKHIGITDPTQGTIRFKPNERERYLTADELPRFLAAVETLRPVPRDLIKTCLYTGARQGNVRSMRWDELNLESRIWTIPASKYKTKVQSTIVLSEPAMQILRARYASRNSEWVFPGRTTAKHYFDVNTPLELALKRAGIEGVRLHDLRRTLGSWMAAAGTSLLVIGKVLGHTSAKSTAIYSRINLDPLREAVDFASMAMATTPEKKSEK